MNTLTGWDYFIALMLGVSVGWGAYRGLVRTVFALAAWVLAALGALLGGPALFSASGAALPLWVVSILVFLLLFVLTRLVGALLARGLSAIGLGGLDRLLGALLGVLRAAVVVAVAALIGAALGLQHEPAWQHAHTRPLLDELVARLMPAMPTRPTGLRQA